VTLFDHRPVAITRVYVMALAEDPDLIKIGISRHPEVRAVDLGMVLLFDVPGDEDLEQSIHERLRPYRAWGRRRPHDGATEEYLLAWEPVQVEVRRLRRRALDHIADDQREWRRASRLWNWAPPVLWWEREG
jgi:hypothetical protein